MEDLIDLNFALADEEVRLVVKEGDTLKECYFQKRFGEDIGITMESAVFDHIRQCHNNCIFLFYCANAQRNETVLIREGRRLSHVLFDGQFYHLVQYDGR